MDVKPEKRISDDPFRAVIVGLSHREQPMEKLQEYLEELEFPSANCRYSNGEGIHSIT